MNLILHQMKHHIYFEITFVFILNYSERQDLSLTCFHYECSDDFVL